MQRTLAFPRTGGNTQRPAALEGVNPHSAHVTKRSCAGRLQATWLAQLPCARFHLHLKPTRTVVVRHAWGFPPPAVQLHAIDEDDGANCDTLCSITNDTVLCIWVCFGIQTTELLTERRYSSYKHPSAHSIYTLSFP